MRKAHDLTQSGSALVQTLIATVVLSFLALALLQLNLLHRQTMFANSLSENTTGRLIDHLQTFRNWDFRSVVAYCSQKGVLGDTPIIGRCLVNGTLRTSGSADPTDRLLGLEQPMDSQGQIATSATDLQSCMELVQCRPRAGGHLLEISMNQYVWMASQSRILSRTRTLRRSKW